MFRPIESGESMSYESADITLDQSQGTQSRQQQQQGSAFGHPRYHVLCLSDDNIEEIINNLRYFGCTEAVTSYHRNFKTALQSKMDQNNLLKEIFKSKIIRDCMNKAIDKLNSGSDQEVLKIATNQIMPNLKMTRVKFGKKRETVDVVSVVLILGHHVNKPKKNYPHVKTFYPTDRTVPRLCTIE